jgi:hypothetical protein
MSAVALPIAGPTPNTIIVRSSSIFRIDASFIAGSVLRTVMDAAAKQSQGATIRSHTNRLLK